MPFDPASLLMPLILVLFLFWMIARGKKAQQQALANRAKVQPGVRVMSNSGLFGTVLERNDEENTAVVELAPGVPVTMHIAVLSPAPEQTVEEPTAPEQVTPGQDAAVQTEPGEKL